MLFHSMTFVVKKRQWEKPCFPLSVNKMDILIGSLVEFATFFFPLRGLYLRWSYSYIVIYTVPSKKEPLLLQPGKKTITSCEAREFHPWKTCQIWKTRFRTCRVTCRLMQIERRFKLTWNLFMQQLITHSTVWPPSNGILQGKKGLTKCISMTGFVWDHQASVGDKAKEIKKKKCRAKGTKSKESHKQ